MRTIQHKTVQIRVKFPDRSLARPLLEDLSKDRALEVNILRGRVTPEEASFDLEVSGAARRIEDFLRLSAAWGGFVDALPAGVA